MSSTPMVSAIPFSPWSNFLSQKQDTKEFCSTCNPLGYQHCSGVRKVPKKQTDIKYLKMTKCEYVKGRKIEKTIQILVRSFISEVARSENLA